MKAIETRYKGYRFRSRLEARWAVFFQNMGILWEYEPEGFETTAGWYLPDFKITPAIHDGWEIGPSFYAEVKPADGRRDDVWEKPKALARWMNVPFEGWTPSVILLNGPPGVTDFGQRKVARFHATVFGCSDALEITHCVQATGPTMSDSLGHVLFNDLGELEVAGANGPIRQALVGLQGRYDKAVTAALSARFEHGERPL